MTLHLRRLLLPLLLLLVSLGARAQTTAEIHYDFGRHIYDDLQGEKPIQVKLKHLSYDKWGRSYSYVRLNPAAKQLYGTEVRLQRDLRFVAAPLALRLEYHGAMRQQEGLSHALSTGIAYHFASESVDLSVAPSYRCDFGKERPHNVQLWGDVAWTSWNRCWTLQTFVVLRTDLGAAEARDRMLLRAEPQLWCHVDQFVGVSDDLHLSLGTELRIEYNTLLPRTLHFCPSLAAKWTF